MKYFAYGSNMARERIEQRLGWCRLLDRARLPGYRLGFRKRGRDGSGKCEIAATGDRRDAVHGVVYELDAAQKQRLDELEGPDYMSRELGVDMHAGRVQVVTYMACAHAICEELSPFAWYKHFVLHGALQHTLPDDYIHVLEAVASVPDPDTARAARNTRIVSPGGG